MVICGYYYSQMYSIIYVPAFAMPFTDQKK